MGSWIQQRAALVGGYDDPAGLVIVGAQSSTFFTTFSGTEDPLSEGGAWIHPATDWKDFKVAGGFAQASSYITDTPVPLFDDNYRFLDPGAFTAPSDNYRITAVVRIVGTPDIAEIEILARMQSADIHTLTGYEFLINTGGTVELVRWNGGLGNFFELTAETSNVIGAWTGNGDVIRCTVRGTNPVICTLEHAPASTPTIFTTIFSYNDTDATRKTAGQPGIGSFIHPGSTALGNIGWDSFLVESV